MRRHHGILAQMMEPAIPVVTTTWNPLDIGNNLSLSPDLLTVTHTALNEFNAVRATTSRTSGSGSFDVLSVSGASPRIMVGICLASSSLNPGGSGFIDNSFFIFSTSIYKRISGVNTILGAVSDAIDPGQTVTVEFDADAELITFKVNGIVQGGGSFSTSDLTGQTFFPFCDSRVSQVSTLNASAW